MRVAQFLFAIILAAASGCVAAPPAPLAQTCWVEYSTRIMKSVAWRKWTPDALVLAGEMAGTLSYILPTHAHFDHMAGAEDLIPAHDRTAWQAAFGESPRCIAGAAR